MSDATAGTRESCLGRIWVLLTLLVVFAAPIWVMLTAGLMQAFPDAMGLEILVDEVGTRRVVTLYSLTVAGTVSGALVTAFMALLSVLGVTSWAIGKVQGVFDRSASQRFEDIAGDAVMPGAHLRTTTEEIPERD